jgi:hypothetical protein
MQTSPADQLFRTKAITIYMGGDAEKFHCFGNKKVGVKTMIYVCRDRVCKLPGEDANEAF